MADEVQNRFIKNIIFLLFLNLLVKPFWILGIDREVQNMLGDGTYGTYLSIYVFSYLFYILLDLGITNFNSRNIAQNPEMLSKHFAGISQVKLFLSLLYAAVVFAVGYGFGYRDGFQLKLLFWCGLNQILLSFILYLRSNIQGLLLFRTDSFLSVFDRVLAIIIMSVLLWSGWFPRENFNIFWFLEAQTLAYVLTFAVALAVVLRHIDKLSFKINIPFCLDILKQSLPFAILVLLMSFYSRLEPFLLDRLLDDGGVQSGIYGRAYRLFDAGNNISNLFAVFLLPMFAATIKKNDDLNGLVKTSFNLIVAMTGVVAIVCMVYSRHIMELMYHAEPGEDMVAFQQRIGQYARIFPILMGSFFCLSTTYVFGTLLTANGSLKHLNIVAASGVVINIVLNLIFIPLFGSVGAACTSLSVQVITAFAQYLIAKRILKLKLGARYWLHIVLFLGSVAIATFLIKRIQMNWLITLIISLCANFALIFLTRLLSINDILGLVKSKAEEN
ncbi:MAG: oligosaccharide flippase family protein [Bacteroidales bacterium]|nr:oligosaccharide flippase family protein [Bacteroidales bacterium]